MQPNNIEGSAGHERPRFMVKFLPTVPAFLLLVLLFNVLTGKNDPSVDLATRIDFYQYFLPLTDLGFDMMYNGQLPLWNPYIFSGMPLVSSIELGFFYPPNWIHLFLQSNHAFDLLVFAHILLAFAGTFYYCRNRGMSIPASVMPSMAYGFSGAMILHLWAGHMSMIYSMAWLPLIMLCADRCFQKRSVLSALALAGALACQFLAGFPLFTLGIALVLVPYAIAFGFDTGGHWRSRKNFELFLLLFAAAALSLALICVQFLPTLEFIENSHRGVLDYGVATAYSFPPRNLVTFIIPDFFGNQVDSVYWGGQFIWESAAYCGVISVLLGLVSLTGIRKSRFVMFWAVVAVLMTGLSLGRHSFFYDVAYYAVPGLKLFRAVGKFCFFTIFAVGLLAGRGLDTLLSDDDPKSLRWIKAVITALLVVGTLGAVVSAAGLTGVFGPPEFLSRAIESLQSGRWAASGFGAGEIERLSVSAFECLLRSTLQTCAVILTAGFCVLVFKFKRQRHVLLLAAILPAILATELYLYDFRYIERSTAQPLAALQTEEGMALSADKTLWRISALSRGSLFINRFIFNRFCDIGGYENAVINRYDRFVKKVTGRKSSWSNVYLQVPYDDRVYDLLNVKYVVAPIENGSQKHVRDARSAPPGNVSYGVFRRNNALGRAFIVHRAKPVGSIEEALDEVPGLLEQGPESGTVVEYAGKLDVQPVDDAQKEMETVEILSYHPNRIRIEAELVQPGILVVSDAWYPGWKAAVNEKPEPVVPANVFMRAVFLDRGHHRVEMKFEPQSFKTGAAITLTAVAACVLTLAAAVVRQRTKRGKDA